MCIPTKKLLNRGFLFVKLKSHLKGFTIASGPITYVRKARGIFRFQTSDFGLQTSDFRCYISLFLL